MTSTQTNPHATFLANPATGEIRPAGLFDRIMAFMPDLTLQLMITPLVFILVASLKFHPFDWLQDLSQKQTFVGPGVPLLILCWLLVAAFYFAWFDGRSGVTPGKRALSMRVTRPDGRPLGFGRALLRFAVATLSWLLGSVPFWVALFNRQRRTLHDYVSGSIVVRTGLPAVDAGQPSRFDYAGYWIRVAAIVIDWLVFVILACWIALIQFWLEESEAVKTLPKILLPLAGLLYNTILVGSWSTTPGKMVFDLAVVTATGERLGFGRALSRHLAFWGIPSAVMLFPVGGDLWLVPLLMFAPLLIWPLFAAFDRQKRALHDRICGTRVIYLR